MTKHLAEKVAAGLMALAGPVGLVFMSAPPSRAQPAAPSTPAPTFEVVSIKPNHEGSGNVMVRMAPGGRFEAQNITLRFLLQEAYGVKDAQISGAPGWVDSEHYNIDAKTDDASAGDGPGDDKRKVDRDDMQARFRLMLQAMLADRFKLALHHDSKELSEYVLVVAKNGPKLHETSAPPADAAPTDRPPGPPAPGSPMPRGAIRIMGRGDLSVSGVALAQFADVLSRQIGHIVVDKTGLKGEYDFTLKWTPDEGQGQMFRGAGEPPREGAPPPPDANGPSIFTALQEQLGLRLKPDKATVPVVIVESATSPTLN